MGPRVWRSRPPVRERTRAMTERFTLISELGRGGMGVVWKARDEQTGQIVALKLLRDTFADDPPYRQRFEHELEIARRITSPHVIKVLGFGARDGTPYIAFEFVDGPSLRQLLVQHGPYSWTQVRAMLLQLAEGLADAHAAGVIHRDIKPSNVMMDGTGTIKLADFGISRALDMTRVTRASGLMGTPAYLAPEGPVDARSDIYSLGVVAFEMLTGGQLFDGVTYHEVLVAHLSKQPDLTRVPAEARPTISWLLAKDPDARPQSARQLIRTLAGGETPPAARPPALPRNAPKAGGVPVQAVVGAVAVIAILGAAATLALVRTGGASSPDPATLTPLVVATAAQLGPSGAAAPAVSLNSDPAASARLGNGSWAAIEPLPQSAWGQAGVVLNDGTLHGDRRFHRPVQQPGYGGSLALRSGNRTVERRRVDAPGARLSDGCSALRRVSHGRRGFLEQPATRYRRALHSQQWNLAVDRANERGPNGRQPRRSA
jgi:hypothetical protein